MIIESVLLSHMDDESLFRVDITSQLCMCVMSCPFFRLMRQEVTPLRQVQLQEQKEGRIATLINSAA
jgi:hypothetical protein